MNGFLSKPVLKDKLADSITQVCVGVLCWRDCMFVGTVLGHAVFACCSCAFSSCKCDHLSVLHLPLSHCRCWLVLAG